MLRAPRITVVPSPACHFCDEADRTLAELARDHTFSLDVVPFDTPEGRRLVAEHRPALSPLVLVDGRFFSSGRLPRRKLERLLAVRDAPAAPDGVPGGR